MEKTINTKSFFPYLEPIIYGLFFLYVFSLPVRQLLIVERNGFIVIVVLLVLWCVIRKCHFFTRTAIDVPLVMFVFWVGLSIPFAIDPGYSFKEFLKLLQQVLLFYAFVYFFQDFSKKKVLIGMMIGESILISLYGLGQFFLDVLPNKRLGSVDVIAAVFTSEVWLTTYLVVLCPFCIGALVYAKENWQKLLALLGVVTIVSCQMLTFSRAGVLAILLEGIVGFALLNKRWALPVIFITVVGIGAVGWSISQVPYIEETEPTAFSNRKLDSSNLIARINVWKLVLSRVADYPITGYGYGKNTFNQVFGDEIRKRHVPVHAEFPMGSHNVFIDFIVSIGLIGSVIFLFLLLSVLFHAYQTFQRAQEGFDRYLSFVLTLLVVGFVVRNSFDHMVVGTLAVLFWVCVGLFFSSQKGRTRLSELE